MRQPLAAVVASDDESLFRALDQRLVNGQGRYWRLTVCGIVSDQTQRWVQMRLAGSPECLLTVRLAVAADALEYYEAVAAWLDGADSSDGTITTSVALCAPPTQSAPSRRLRLVH